MRLKLFVLLFLIILKSNSGLQSQTIDTICAPTVKMKQVYADAMSFRLTDSLLKIAESQIVELKGKIKLLEDHEVEQRNFYEGQIRNLQGQIELYVAQVRGYETINARLSRQLKFQKVLRNGSMLVVAGLLVKMFIFK